MLDTKRFEGPVKEELHQYKYFYKNTLKSKTKLLDVISNYVHSRKANSLLPLFTFLSAKISGEITSNTFVAASVIDHLYTATRIHDDVEDESYGNKILIFKIKALWKEKLSVLMGDYFLAKGLLLSVNNKTYDLLEIVSKSVKEFTEGELINLYNFRNLYIDKNNYFEIISKKSASIYGACAKAGAISGGANKESINILSAVGKNFGIAYHIKNELNYSNTIINSKYRITLPFILALENSDEKEKNQMLKYLQYPVEKELTAYIQSFTQTNGGIDKSVELINDYRILSLDNLTEFSYSESLESLKRVINSALIL